MSISFISLLNYEVSFLFIKVLKNLYRNLNNLICDINSLGFIQINTYKFSFSE